MDTEKIITTEKDDTTSVNAAIESAEEMEYPEAVETVESTEASETAESVDTAEAPEATENLNAAEVIETAEETETVDASDFQIEIETETAKHETEKQKKEKKRHAINRSFLPTLLFYPLAMLYFELFLKLLDSNVENPWGFPLIPIVVYSLFAGLLMSVLFWLIRPVLLSRILSGLTMVLLWVFFCIEFDCNIFYNMYYGIVYTLSMTGQVMGDFSSVVFTYALKLLPYELALSVPVIVHFIFIKKIIPPKEKTPKRVPGVLVLMLLVPLVLLFGASELISRLGPNKNLYTYDFTVQNSVPAIGLMNTTRLEVGYLIFGTPEAKAENKEYTIWTPDEVTSELASEVIVPDSSEATSEEPPAPVVYEYNAAVDFASLIETETDPTKKAMHEYFGSLEPTKQNEYTGYFEGKNLIFISAEAFCPYAVDKEFTPTLYKLANNGFVFENYYQPSWSLSTTGGEFANMTGLIPEWINTSNSFIESAKDYMPYAPGHMFTNAGYVCRAYHNNSYSYYSRDLTHPNLGYDYKGLGNGLVLEHNSWPNSDLEMMEATIDEAIAAYKETGVPFHNYYMSVSGHCNYNWGGNAMSAKHRAEAEAAFPDSSIPVQAYMACNKELDLAMEYLLKRLDEEGILNDTVIVMGADHYPYAMAEGATDYYKELSGIDDTTRSVSRYKNTLVLYCAAMEEPVYVDTPCSSIDIMPTLCNLFGLKYDSRLYSGRDIFATNYVAEEASYTMPLVIVPIVGSNGYSFVTAAGTYESTTKEFTPREGVVVADDFVAKVQTIINEKWKYAKLIITSDYYRSAIK